MLSLSTACSSSDPHRGVLDGTVASALLTAALLHAAGHDKEGAVLPQLVGVKAGSPAATPSPSEASPPAHC